MVGTMFGELTSAGLTTSFMVEKFHEWLNAQKVVSALIINPKGEDGDLEPANSQTKDFIEVPDYKTQLEAYKEWKKIADQEIQSNTTGKPVKRKLTIEEYVTGEEGGTNESE